jgi:hypothetical protein
MTARVHKRRRAGPRPPKSKKKVEPPRYGRIDGVRKWMVARHQGRWEIGWSASRGIGALSVMRPVTVRNLRIGWIIAAGERNSDPVETPIQLNRHYEQSEAIQGECYANPSS